MKTRILLKLALVSISLTVAAHATVIGYVSNLSGNSTDFSTAVAGAGGTITTYTFNDLATGGLSPSAYAGLTFSGNINQVAFGNGPGDGNDASGPLSPGEGANGASNYVWSGVNNDSLTVNFASSVSGVGLFVIDSFNIFGTTTNISAFDSSNNLLGSFNGANFNFQNNNLYFMGITSSASDIASVVFSHFGSSTGDRIALDNLQVATGGSTVPDSGSTLLLLGGAMTAFAAFRRRQANR